MMYGYLIGYLLLVYLRPGEIVPEWEGLPIVKVYAAIGVPVVLLSQLNRPRRLLDLPHDWAVVWLTIAALASNVVGGWVGGALVAASVFLPAVAPYLLMRLAIGTERELRGIVIVVIVLSVVQALNGIVQFHAGSGLGAVGAVMDHLDPEGARQRIRGTGVFNDPNDLAIALVITVPFLLSNMMGPAVSGLRRMLAAAALVPILLAIVYTSSRGGFVALGVILVLWTALRFGRIFALGAAAVAVFALVILAGDPRFVQMDPEEAAAQGRIQAWSEGLAMFKASPVFGVGLGRFDEFHDQVAHNSFVHLLAELGLVGAIAAVGAVYWFFRPLLTLASQGRRGEDGEAEMAGDIALAGLGFCLGALFLSRQYVAIMYVVLGLGACQAALARDELPEMLLRSRGRDMAWIVGATAAGIVVTYVMVRAFAVWR